ncbi:MAG: carbohydrate kinase family protein [Candidatus Saganbacteria bacterium]|nr:carbohydrate kinase family protein [Candidatus Saganbacteria bacterium]
MNDVLIIGEDGRSLVALSDLQLKAEYLEIVKDKIPWRDISDSEWLLLNPFPQKSLDLFLEVAEFARENGVKIVFRPGEFPKVSPKWIKPFLKIASILIINIDNASKLTGIDREDKDGILRKLRNNGAKVVVLTDRENVFFVYAGKVKYSKKPDQVDLEGGSGGGAAFSSGFLAGYIKKRDIDFAIAAGCANAASVLKKGIFLKSEDLMGAVDSFERDSIKIRKSPL